MNAITDSDRIKLEKFNYEVGIFTKSCAKELKSEKIKTGELFDKGTILYEEIDPIIERGLIATARLFTSSGQTVEFSRIANIVSFHLALRPLKVRSIRKYKNNFNELKKESRKLFDLYENIKHLHFDISDTRHKEYDNITHSCQGPLAHAEVCDKLEKMAQILTEFNNKFVIKIIN